MENGSAGKFVVNLLIFLILVGVLGLITYPWWKDWIWEPQPPEPPQPPIQAQECIKSRQSSFKFVTQGQMEDDNWGTGKLYNVTYEAQMEVKSVIVKSPKDKSSEDKSPEEQQNVIVEERIFEAVTDRFVAIPEDLRLSIETLPVDQLNTVTKIWAAWYIWKTKGTGTETAGKVTGTVEMIVKYLKEHDGQSINQLLPESLQINKEDIETFQEIVEKIPAFKSEAIKFESKLRNVSGKRYLVTWYLDKDGNLEPNHTQYQLLNSDSEPEEVTDEEDLSILKRANLLIDYAVMKNSFKSKDGNSWAHLAEGTTWNIAANDLQAILDPFNYGDYSGIIKVVAHKIDKEKEWKLDVNPAHILMTATEGSSSSNGEISISDGYFLISNADSTLDPTEMAKNVSTSEAKLNGTVAVSNLSKHHLLFKKKFKGACRYSAEFTSSVLPEEESSNTADSSK